MSPQLALQPTPAPTTGAFKTSARLAWAVLLALCLVLAGLRALTFHWPLDRDCLIYAVTSHELLSGRPLYSDMWDLKPPGIYLSYAIAELVGGYNGNTIFWLGVVAGVATLFGVFGAVLSATRSRSAALCASAFWAIVAGSVELQANQPNSEVFLNAAFVGGLWLFLCGFGSASSSLRTRLLWGAGLVWGVATLWKQIAFFTPLFLSFALLFLAGKNVPLKTRLAGTMGLVFPTIGVWGATFAYFAATGRSSIFIWTFLQFGQKYARDGARLNAALPVWQKVFPPSLWLVAPLLLLICLGLLVGRGRFTRQWRVLGLCALATQAAVALPSYFFPHYFQLWLPLVCIGAGVAVASVLETPQTTGNPRAVAGAGAAVVFVALLAMQWPTWTRQQPANEYTHLMAQMPHVSQQLNALLLPGETIYQYGFDPGFYFYSKRRPPAGAMVVGTPTLALPDWFQERIIADLERQKPEIAIVDAHFPTSLVFRYLNRNYEPMAQRFDLQPMKFLVRRAGRLGRRQHATVSQTAVTRR